MKNSIIAALVSALSVICMSGCGESAGMMFENVGDSISYRLDSTAGSDSPTLSIKIDMQFAKTDTEDELAKKAAETINTNIENEVFSMSGMPEEVVDSFIKSSTELYVQTMFPLYAEDKQKGATMASAYDNYHNISGKAVEGHSGIINYMVTEEMYNGGAHPVSVTTYLNFNRETGELIELDALFKEGYKEKLDDILLKALMKQCGAKNVKELNDAGYLCFTDMYASSNFLLKEDEIEFYYNVYEIAPYVMGPTVLNIKYEEIKDLMIDNSKDFK